MVTYAIGDIHGCKDELITLIRSLRNQGLEHEDTLVFMGDYIDRGHNSKGVIDTLLLLSEYQKCVFLMGNHEDMMLWYLNIQHQGVSNISRQSMEYGSYWLSNGGHSTLKSYGIEDLTDFHEKYGSDSRTKLVEMVGEQHLEFLTNLQYYYIEDSHLFVHAGISSGGLESETPEEAIENSTDEHLLWDREAYLQSNKFGTMIYGHTPSKQGVRWLPHKEDSGYYNVGVDVGCVYGNNPLTAVRTSDWLEIR